MTLEKSDVQDLMDLERRIRKLENALWVGVSLCVIFGVSSGYVYTKLTDVLGQVNSAGIKIEEGLSRIKQETEKSVNEIRRNATGSISINSEGHDVFSPLVATFPVGGIDVGINLPNDSWRFSKKVPGEAKFEFYNNNNSLSGTVIFERIFNGELRKLSAVPVNTARDAASRLGGASTVLRQIEVLHMGKPMIETLIAFEASGVRVKMINWLYSGPEGTAQIVVSGSKEEFDKNSESVMEFMSSLVFRSDSGDVRGIR